MNVSSVGALRPFLEALKKQTNLEELVVQLISCPPIHWEPFPSAKKALLSLKNIQDQKYVIRKSYEIGAPPEMLFLEFYEELDSQKRKNLFLLFKNGDSVDKYIADDFISYLKKVNRLEELWVL